MMDVNVIDRKGGVAGEAKQKMRDRLRKPSLPMGQFMPNRGANQGEEVANDPDRANQLERVIREAWIFKRV